MLDRCHDRFGQTPSIIQFLISWRPCVPTQAPCTAYPDKNNVTLATTVISKGAKYPLLIKMERHETTEEKLRRVSDWQHEGCQILDSMFVQTPAEYVGSKLIWSVNKITSANKRQ